MISVEDLERYARNLNGQLAQEPQLRCAISRAYYAAFHRCSDAAKKWCGPLQKVEEEGKGVHEKLYTQLTDHSKHPQIDDDLKVLAEEAKKLRTLRTIADYHLDKDVGFKDVTRSFHHMDLVRNTFNHITTTVAAATTPATASTPNKPAVNS